MTTDRVSAIVLAGGRSSRFGRDKLAEPLDGRPLLDHAIDAVRPFATEILVVVAPSGRSAVPSGVRVVLDETAFEGPLAGLHAGLAEATGEIVLVTAGDMPQLVPAVAEAMLARLDPADVDAVVLSSGGQPRPLPMLVRREPAAKAASRLIESGERRLRSLVDGLGATVIDEPVWRAFDPDGRTTCDIDTPEDLRRMARHRD